MNHTLFHRLAKAIEREAALWGFYGDVFADDRDIPLVGTENEQRIIATIGSVVSPGRMSTRDRDTMNSMVRAAVLKSPAQFQTESPEGMPRTIGEQRRPRTRRRVA